MVDLFNFSVDNLFPTYASQNSQREQYALSYLEKGLTEYSDGNYSQAIQTLKQAVAMAPTADSAISAYDYIATSYMELGDYQSAVAIYKDSITASPTRDATHVSLGNLYTTMDRLDDARAEYEKAVNINPSSANRYSLGQGYMAVGLTDQALRQFELVQQSSPTEPYGKYGMGLAYAKLGRYDDATRAFADAISIQSDYWDAYAELGYTLFDSGDASGAKDVLSTLESNDSSLADSLSEYIYEKSQPKMVAAYTSDIFPQFLTSLSPGTKVSTLSSYLSQADSEKVLSVTIMFSKTMDAASVENELNWTITRATGTAPGAAYNNGIAVPDTEATIAQTPWRSTTTAPTIPRPSCSS
ncbi:tetratricopeptide repeat protein [Parasulfuritortus cantonensis]|uniref:Tetratricopeptide repeat protein n=1 Tax=Parasulfuritortus cantonensis TaxID=2528202 RepID=A0A4R1B5Y8_9PROT|nr:tetratricopeptide repeat protein [Parasulfuritortus cantonensis]TCJ11608.1 tetratricopeptide repeat protein [Parasulfuritortus cantonensis]